ncbi:MAG: M50 family metallopeptidase [Anaerolineales bacterium]
MSDLLLFVIVLGTLILGHEFGHFLAARWRGVKVEEFGLGYPPRIATLFVIGETRYTVNWIPFGGFVRLAGEDDPDVSEGLSGASKLTRAIVLLAGPAANIAVAFVVFVIAFKFAAPDFNRVRIGQVTPNTPAAQAGIEVGDIVEEAAGTPINSFESLQKVTSEHLGKPMELMLDRSGAPVTISLVPREDYPEGQGPIGVTLSYPTAKTSWGEATQMSVSSIGSQVMAILRLPGRLLSGDAAPEEARVSGLKGIYDMLGWASSIDRTSERPFITMNLIGVISVGLALANLLPFPALDGGRLMFVFIELIIRRRISPQLEGYAHAIGFAVLIILMIYINLQDFVNPIQLP